MYLSPHFAPGTATPSLGRCEQGPGMFEHHRKPVISHRAYRHRLLRAVALALGLILVAAPVVHRFLHRFHVEEGSDEAPQARAEDGDEQL